MKSKYSPHSAVRNSCQASVTVVYDLQTGGIVIGYIMAVSELCAQHEIGLE